MSNMYGCAAVEHIFYFMIKRLMQTHHSSTQNIHLLNYRTSIEPWKNS